MKMKTFILAILVLLLPVSTSMTGESVIPKMKLEKAVRIATSDGVGKGYCGRGVWSVLKGIGFGRGLRSGDGHDWEKILKKAGWKSIRCVRPAKAPVGSVLVYNSDRRRFGKNKAGTLGGIYGHVELVAVRGGKRVYVSDAPRVNPGGSVPKNFTGRAWLPPGSVVRAAPVRVVSLGMSSLPSRRLDFAEAERASRPSFNLGPTLLHPGPERKSLPAFLSQPIVGMAGIRIF
jgi:hypothetical protein